MSLHTFRASKMQAWLLPFALVFSLFAFSGSATPTIAMRAFVTEQVVPILASGKRQVVLKIPRPSFQFKAAPDLLHALLHHERVVEIQLAQRLPGPMLFPESGRHQSLRVFAGGDEDSILLG